jgi:hypothetical protein
VQIYFTWQLCSSIHRFKRKEEGERRGINKLTHKLDLKI